MEKDNFFTRARFETKWFCLKKCDESNLRQNSVKGLKDPKTQNVLKNATTKCAKSRHYSLSWQRSVKFCKDFTRDKICLHKYCLHVCTFFSISETALGVYLMGTENVGILPTLSGYSAQQMGKLTFKRNNFHLEKGPKKFKM